MALARALPSYDKHLYFFISSCQYILMAVGNEKEGGVGKMTTVHNMSLTVAIDVLFSLNFAFVLIFIYFRFRPSKAKSIGNVLTNRQNAANCCLHRGFKKSAEELRMVANILTQRCILRQ